MVLLQRQYYYCSPVRTQDEKPGEACNRKSSMIAISQHARTNSKASADQSSESGDSSLWSTRQSDEETESIKEQLAREETEAVFRLRALVILILIAAASVISVTVFFLTRNAEKEDLETHYYGAAEKIIHAFQDIMVEISAVSGLAVAETADSIKQDLQWPFVTMSSFQERAGNARELSGALYVTINPIVSADELPAWEKYAIREIDWVEEGFQYQERQGVNGFGSEDNIDKSWLTNEIVDPLHTFDESGWPLLSHSEGPFLPRWQTSPVLQTSMVNENIFEKPYLAAVSNDCIQSKSAVLGGFMTAPPGPPSHSNPTTSFLATLISMWKGEEAQYQGDPMAYLMIPIFDKLDGDDDRTVVGVLSSTIHWRGYLEDILPSTTKGITVVIENSCDGFYTFEMDGAEALIVGEGDRHDRNFGEYHVEGGFTTEHIKDGTVDGINLNQDGCPYTFHVYPTREFYDGFISRNPVLICCSVAFVFLFTILMFLMYDRLVERRQRLVLSKANQSTAIVSSLFPKQIRDRLMAEHSEEEKRNSMMAPNHRLKSYLSGDAQDVEAKGAQPIADLFPHCTVFFSDIRGFTAWSSTREPAQVFILLQTVYQAFDAIAHRRRVFKVETIGDSYVAVTGLPEPQAKHAVIMAKFAWECLIISADITKSLEVQLGPDTGELQMRFGLHSGPVTAGVLKGDRARFQLFGDTVNTAARMESTGREGKIQISQSTANLLKSAGKEAWVTARHDSVEAKGKGVLDTYWLSLNTSQSDSIISSESGAPRGGGRTGTELDSLVLKKSRLVGWVVDALLEHIKKIVVVREKCTSNDMTDTSPIHFEGEEGKTCLDEVKEVINMPHFNENVALATHESNTVTIPAEVTGLLREYVTMIAKLYLDNPFHNFEHACHVTMSVNKLISRIATPDLEPGDSSPQAKGSKEMAAQIHNFTHGVTSEPMAAFAITFSALIHDVDHQGISNPQLIKEKPEMGKQYRNKSVAEQNSLDVAWGVLMSDQFEKLREYVFGTRQELLRFRQLIVNVVLATDIFDKELNDLRKARWSRAFHADGSIPGNLVSDYRATIVMEHIIQASDVCHTMQHWHVYQKWNRRLFMELHKAFRHGRMGANPADFWYQGELEFFDNYVIPLAKKLKDCNVFGVSSDEYLNYAMMNRAEWKERGKGLVQGMLAELSPGVVEEEEGVDQPSESSTGDSIRC